LRRLQLGEDRPRARARVENTRTFELDARLRRELGGVEAPVGSGGAAPRDEREREP
jgi:hypothetical protein